MKDRQKDMLLLVLREGDSSLDSLMRRYSISRRTLYYDIEDINEEIKDYGVLQVVNKTIIFFGDYINLLTSIHDQIHNDMYDKEYRCRYVLLSVLSGGYDNLSSIYKKHGLSSSTFSSDMRWVEMFMSTHEIFFDSKDRNNVIGNEYSIRNLYLDLIQKMGVFQSVSSEILDFNARHKLHLTTESLKYLTQFMSFLSLRIDKKHYVQFFDSPVSFNGETMEEDVANLLNTKKICEINYFIAFVSSLTTGNLEIKNEAVESYMDALIDEFEKRSANKIADPLDFKRYMRPHMVALYNRRLFRFPEAIDVTSRDLDIEFDPIYNIVRLVVEILARKFPSFGYLSEGEICFIASYFGAYLACQNGAGNTYKKLLLVCPNGLVVSKTLQFEITGRIPGVTVVNAVSISRISEYKGKVDAVVSTVPINDEHLDIPVILVHPSITEREIQEILSVLFGFGKSTLQIDINQLIGIIEKNATVHDRSKLEKDLTCALYHKADFIRKESPMLKELLTPDHIVCGLHANNWNDAIQLAAQPLLTDGSIEQSYVQCMIKSVNENGPYIVLADNFALPHAQAGVGVNKLGMSLLSLDEEVDLLGNPVKTLLVLAAVDTTSHLRALSCLTEMLCDETNLEIFVNGDRSKIIQLIEESE